MEYGKVGLEIVINIRANTRQIKKKDMECLYGVMEICIKEITEMT